MDNRLETFLVLCETMNYRKTAEILHLTQPAVTRQIQSLEAEYGTELFIYDGRKLSRTYQSRMLEEYAVSAKYNYKKVLEDLRQKEIPTLRIGATKTIGEFVIGKRIKNYLQKENCNLSLLVDNTENLLEKLRNQELDFALVEGFFDKKKYASRLYAKEPFVGICGRKHPFAGKKVSWEDLWQEKLFIREEGSGTRQIFEQQLRAEGYTLEHFKKVTSISSFSLIRSLVADGMGITFAYEAVIGRDKRLESFVIENNCAVHEFYFVFLKNTGTEHLVEKFLKESSRKDDGTLGN